MNWYHGVIFSWFIFGAFSYGFSMGYSFVNDDFYNFANKYGSSDGARYLFRGWLLSIIAWPYLIFRDGLLVLKRAKQYDKPKPKGQLGQ